jgi:hypothetical protein
MVFSLTNGISLIWVRRLTLNSVLNQNERVVVGAGAAMMTMGVNMAKELVHYQNVTDFDSYSIDEFVKYLQSIKKRFDKTHKKITIQIEDEWGYYDEHWVNIKFYAERKQCKSKK